MGSRSALGSWLALLSESELPLVLESELPLVLESELRLELVWALDSVWVSGWIHLR
jgi:hypothetical protein